MKVLIVNALYPPHRVGGAERSVALLAEALARDGDEVVVATLDDGALPAHEVVGGVRIERLPLDNGYWPFGDVDAAPSAPRRLAWHVRNRWNARAARRFGALLDRERPDIVHCHVITGFSVAIWAEVKARGLPLVQTLRDYGLICARSALFRRGRQCARRCVECRLLTCAARGVSAQVDQLVTNSDYVLAAHRAAGFFEGVAARRIFNIVPAVRRTPAPSEGPLRFGFLGRVEAEKGVEILLAAASALEGDWRLDIAGVGRSDYVGMLRRRYPDPRIAWAGFVEAGGFYAGIDVLIIPSLWPEPLPRTLIEGLAQGLSAICSTAGGVPEIAGLAHRSALYPPEDAAALRSAMAAAIADAQLWRTRAPFDPAALAVFSEAEVVAQNRQAYRDASAAV